MKAKLTFLIVLWCKLVALVPQVNAGPVQLPAVSQVQGTTLGQIDIVGGIMDAFEWFFGVISNFVNFIVVNTYMKLKEWIRDFICAIRMVAANALGYFFCIQCSAELADPGGGIGHISVGCYVMEGCECTACVGHWIAPYTHYIEEAIAPIIGSSHVFSKFIPWQLWAVLMAAYVTLAAVVWAAKMAAQIGPFLAMI